MPDKFAFDPCNLVVCGCPLPLSGNFYGNQFLQCCSLQQFGHWAMYYGENTPIPVWAMYYGVTGQIPVWVTQCIFENITNKQFGRYTMEKVGKYQLGQCTMKIMGKKLAVVVVGDCMLGRCWSACHLSKGGPAVY